jgi:threonine dehydrogenase-like Zn-dependent dehydrogenase
MGHKSLGHVVDAPPQSPFRTGDLVVGIVRNPDPVPCAHCAAGEWDMCSNGRYTERGIKASDGFAAEFFSADAVVKVDPKLGLTAVLLEPASVLARRGSTSSASDSGRCGSPGGCWSPGLGRSACSRRFLVRIAGSKCMCRITANTDRSRRSRARSECTGVPNVIRQVLAGQAPNRIVCLTGLCAVRSDVALDAAAFNQAMVLGNAVVFGSVNANRRHYEAAAATLARAERSWLERLITRKVPLRDWQAVYEKQEGDVKTVMLFED